MRRSRSTLDAYLDDLVQRHSPCTERISDDQLRPFTSDADSPVANREPDEQCCDHEGDEHQHDQSVYGHAEDEPAPNERAEPDELLEAPCVSAGPENDLAMVHA